MKLIKTINRFFELKQLYEMLNSYPKLTIDSICSFSFEEINEICDLKHKISTLKYSNL